MVWLFETRMWWKWNILFYGQFHCKAGCIYKVIGEDVGTRFGTSKYELDRPLPRGKNKKVIGN